MVMYEDNPLDRVQVDIIELSQHLARDERYKYLITVVDHHSKKAWTKLVRRRKPEIIVNFLEQLFDKVKDIIGRYPKSLHTDNGIEFKNPIVKDFCDKREINLVHGAPYHS